MYYKVLKVHYSFKGVSMRVIHTTAPLYILPPIINLSPRMSKKSFNWFIEMVWRGGQYTA
jgi:hypothetical protein